jgi:cysteine desulfurase / selenocysteine lyase
MPSYKQMFRRATEVAYLDTAAEGLPVPQAEDALREYIHQKSLGTPGRRALFAAEAETIELAARLLGTGQTNVALLSSASEALNVLPNSLDWRPGDEVILTDAEFPSNILACLRLKQRGVKVHVAGFDSRDIAARLSPRTRLISISLVSYKTGVYFGGLPDLARKAKQLGALISVDATQGLGRCPISLEGVDFLMSSSFKWLLGSHGLGIVYVAPELCERLSPASVGWYSVPDCFTTDRFERYELKAGAGRLCTGMPNFGPIYTLREGLKFLLAAGVQNIFHDLAPVVAHVRSELASLGLAMLTPPDAECASGIVAFEHPRAREISAALEREGVIVWGGDGRVRCSVHLYNDEADIERYIDRLKFVLTQVDAAHA